MQKKNFLEDYGEVKKYAIDNNAIVAICGCMMQQEEMVQKIKESYNFVNLVFGTHTMHKLPEHLYNILENRYSLISPLLKNNNKEIKKYGRIFDILDIER